MILLFFILLRGLRGSINCYLIHVLNMKKISKYLLIIAKKKINKVNLEIKIINMKYKTIDFFPKTIAITSQNVFQYFSINFCLKQFLVQVFIL